MNKENFVKQLYEKKGRDLTKDTPVEERKRIVVNALAALITIREDVDADLDWFLK